jgi:hypothetical protein
MYNLQKLHAVHREVIRLRASGMTQVDIANELGMTIAFVSLVVNSELGKIAMEELQSRMDEETIEVGVALQRNAKAAEQFLGGIVTGAEQNGISPALRARVCMDQLDRAGFGKITKNLNVDMAGTITAEEIAEIKAEGRRMANFVDVSAEGAA